MRKIKNYQAVSEENSYKSEVKNTPNYLKMNTLRKKYHHLKIEIYNFNKN
jgi:hypothetical protein